MPLAQEEHLSICSQKMKVTTYKGKILHWHQKVEERLKALSHRTEGMQWTMVFSKLHRN